MENLKFNWYYIFTPLGLILLASLVLSVFKLRKNKALAEKLCYVASWTVLIYKTFHFIIYCASLGHDWTQQIPCEISQLTFFICPIAYLSKNKYIRDIGAFLGVFAGIVQVIGITVAPNSFANSGNLTVVSLIESTIMHYLVLWIGIVQITSLFKLKVKNLWSVYLGVLLVILWGVLASFTWRYGTDAGYPDAPANIAFVQRCVLPESITNAMPWLLKGHLFIFAYLIAFFIFTAAVYVVSYLSFKNREESADGIYGTGWSDFNKILKKPTNGNNQN